MEDKTNKDHSAAPVRTIEIIQAAARVEREPLLTPFGFKGGRLTELWQSIVQLSDGEGNQVVGLGVQSGLWSDPELFNRYMEGATNELMFKITQEALHFLKGRKLETPVAIFDELFEHSFAYGKKITACPDLKKTFVLNALTPVDNALWLLYAARHGIADFSAMIPSVYRKGLSHQNDKLIIVPVVSYGMPVEEIRHLLDQGAFLLKIKLGHAGLRQQMLEKDKEWMSVIHQLTAAYRTPHSPDGKIRYYLDANGRYQTKADVQRLLDHLKAIGALQQVVLLEEPFGQSSEITVDDLAVRVAMDERAHSDIETTAGLQMGYRAIALKPIAKTLSMTLRILERAQHSHVPCFCADLTANPVLVEWNKNVAARLPSFPDMEGSLMEINGHQQYRNWSELLRHHPCSEASWTDIQKGVIVLNADFYQQSGCIFKPLPHYQKLFNA